MRPIKYLTLSASSPIILVLATLFLFLGTPDLCSQEILNGQTPPALAPGAPAGTYPLSGFENINLFNGNLNVRMGLLSIGGRGSAGFTMSLPIEGRWVIDRQYLSDPCGNPEVPGCNPSDYFVDYPMYGLPQQWPPIGYGPGVLRGRLAVGRVPCNVTLSGISDDYDNHFLRLTFITADGTEYELRDQLHDGQPISNPNVCSPLNNPARTKDYSHRGKVFVSKDGNALTFIADQPVYDFDSLDTYPNGGIVSAPNGTLFFADGTRYRIENGLVRWILDRNGNKTQFEYAVSPQAIGRVTRITDPLNRPVVICYAGQSPTADCPVTQSYDEITWSGFQGTARSLKVQYGLLSATIHNSYSITSMRTLFPELASSIPADYDFDQDTIASVELPDGRKYEFKYNNYAELARVKLPTGGVLAYEMESGITGSSSGAHDGGAFVHRRLKTRRVYPDGLTEKETTTYAATYNTEANPGPGGADGAATVEVQRLDPANANALLAFEKHYYYGAPLNLSFRNPLSEPHFKDGKEEKTESFDVDGTTLLRRFEHTWEEAPLNFPHISKTTATLDDNQMSRQLFSYDVFGNRTDVFELDHGVQETGAPLRHTHTDFVVTNNVPGSGVVDYAGTSITDSTSPSSLVHMRRLPKIQWVAGASDTSKLSYTSYDYDQTNPLSPCAVSGLTPCPAVAGHEAAYDINYRPRGNATAIKRRLASPGTSAESGTDVTTSHQYDIAGNLVSTTDPRSALTAFDYADRFGVPGDSEASSNTPPGLVNGQYTYAFPTRVINDKGHQSYSQFDYFSGKPVNTADVNGVITDFVYDDSLDRLTQAIQAANHADKKSQTVITYDAPSRLIRTERDQELFDDRRLKSEVQYDGLGRTEETRQFEDSGFIATDQIYDGMGRSRLVSNPYRPGLETVAWTETVYDGLGRIKQVTNTDGTQVGTNYTGNRTEVVDAAGKKRQSYTDAAGRLKQVDEPDSSGNFGSPESPLTTYTYDALDNLRTVTQGGQSRTFAYDSLSQLKSAFNPESGTVSYVYDNNGNLIQKTDARSTATNFGYDSLNRVQTKSYSDGTPQVTYCYDFNPADCSTAQSFAVGRLTKVSSSVSSTSSEGLHPLGWVEKTRQTTGSDQYVTEASYNLAGQIKTQKYPSGRVATSTYDRAGRTIGLTGQKTGEANKTYASGFSYASHGAIRQMTLGNGLWEETRFNNRLQPTQIGLGTSASSNFAEYGLTPANSDRLLLTYGYGGASNNGNLLSQQIQVAGNLNVTQSYQYDPLNRLDSASENGSSPWSHDYIYDRFGNRAMTSNFQLPSETPTQLSDFSAATNRINKTVNGVAFQYDAVGNLAQMPRDSGPSQVTAQTLVYDAENRQVQATTDGVATTYAYDGDGRRVKKQIGTTAPIYYVYNAQGQLAAEYGAPSQPSSTSYLTSDHLGSTRMVTDGGGIATTCHDYYPFGTEIPSSVGGRNALPCYTANLLDGPSQKFTAKERDSESNLDYFGARYFSGAQGRFTSADDIYNDTNAADPSSWNRYAYVRNNPLATVDPDGTAAVKLTDFATRALGLDQPRRNDVSYFKSYVANLAVAAIGGMELSVGLATGNVPNLVPDSLRNAADGNTQAKFDVNLGFNIGGLASAVTVGPKAPNFVVSEGGDVIPVPEGATGPVPVVNRQGETTGFAFTGGQGGNQLHPNVSGVRVMDGASHSPNGYVVYQNAAKPRPQGVNPQTGRTVPNSDRSRHIPLSPPRPQPPPPTPPKTCPGGGTNCP